MNKFKLAFASNNNDELTSKHFGDSENFVLYEIFEDGIIKLDKKIINNFKDVDESTAHGSKEKRQSIIAYLGKDIDFIVASQMSPNFKQINMKTKVSPIVSEIKNIDKVLDYLKNNYNLLKETKIAKLENKNIEILRIKRAY